MSNQSLSQFSPYSPRPWSPANLSSSALTSYHNDRKYFPYSSTEAVAPLYMLKSGPEFEKIVYESEADRQKKRELEERVRRGTKGNPFFRAHLVDGYGEHWYQSEATSRPNNP